MNDSLETLLEKMRVLEKDILCALQEKEEEFFYEVHQGKIRFTGEARKRHKLLVKKFTTYVRDSRFLILLTIPVIWALILPSCCWICSCSSIRPSAFRSTAFPR